MPQGNKSQTVNNHISGARQNGLNRSSITYSWPGGVGGDGGTGGQGGAGGTGEGPRLNYGITAEDVTIHNQYVGYLRRRSFPE
jgi:hypothetical protein